MRKSEDQVDARADTGGGRVIDRLARTCGVVNASDRLKLSIVKRLHADAQSICAERSPEFDRFGRDILRIRFEREFGIVSDVECVANRGDEPRSILRRRPRGRTAAEEDRVRALPIRPPLDLADERVDVGALKRQVGADREWAIRAVDAAEWKVDVDAKGHEIKNFKFEISPSFDPEATGRC